jgi:hypothetical protein
VTIHYAHVENNVYITDRNINADILKEKIARHGHAIVIHVNSYTDSQWIVYTVGLSNKLLPELYFAISSHSPLRGSEMGIITSVITEHQKNEMTVGDHVSVPDSTNDTIHEFSVIPVTFSSPLPGISAVFPYGPAWSVEIVTHDCRCPYCRQHRRR